MSCASVLTGIEIGVEREIYEQIFFEDCDYHLTENNVTKDRKAI